MKDKGKMTRTAAARIQASACKSNNGTTPQYSFASRAMSAAYRNEPLSHNSFKSDGGKGCPCPCTLL